MQAAQPCALFPATLATERINSCPLHISDNTQHLYHENIVVSIRELSCLHEKSSGHGDKNMKPQSMKFLLRKKYSSTTLKLNTKVTYVSLHIFHCFGKNSFSLKKRNYTDEVLIYLRDAPEKVQLHQVHSEFQRKSFQPTSNVRRETAFA